MIQRRDDFGEPRENFNRDWADYKNGFGDPAKEFWMGNENIYMLTNNEDYALRIELEDFEGNKRSISMQTNPLFCFMMASKHEKCFLTFLFSVFVIITDMRNIHTSKSAPKLITTNLKLMATKEMLGTHSMIRLMVQITVHSPHTIEIMTGAR